MDLTTIEAVEALLAGQDYLADRDLATVVYLSLSLGRPLFLEGDAGVGKTEIAKVLASGLKRPLIRLQCYEGLDLASAAYEWNYAAQMLEIRRHEAKGASSLALYDDRFLIRRPLLEALEGDGSAPPVLLIDELDRTDAAFEAFLLEVLSEFQISIPEIGVVKAKKAPIVVLTSNRTREVHDAIKRRCLYHWLDYPDLARELAIVRQKLPAIEASLAASLVAFVQALREQDLYKKPGVAETLDWAAALMTLNRESLDPASVRSTLGVLLKYQEDLAKIKASDLPEQVMTSA